MRGGDDPGRAWRDRPAAPLGVVSAAASALAALVVAVTVAAATLAAPGPASAVAPETSAEARERIEEVRDRREAVQAELDAAAVRLAEVQAAVAVLVDDVARLETERDQLLEVVIAADARIEDRIRRLYMLGTASPVMAVIAGGDPGDAVERAQYVQHLVGADALESEVADNERRRLRAVVARVRAQRVRLSEAEAEQRRVQAELEADLDAAARAERDLVALEEELREAEERARREAEERRRREEAARRAREAAERAGSAPTGSVPAPVPVGSGGMACPVAYPHSFTDTWGAPRSGGRSHQGTDILAARGQTVIAIVSGTWEVRPYGSSAGYWGILDGDDGSDYWYLHLQSHLVGDGARVGAGQAIALNGDTGNARGTTPHVHFEVHPGGGGAVNPYPLLRAIC